MVIFALCLISVAALFFLGFGIHKIKYHIEKERELKKQENFNHQVEEIKMSQHEKSELRVKSEKKITNAFAEHQKNNYGKNKTLDM